MDNIVMNDIVMDNVVASRRPRTYRHRPSQLLDTFTETEIHDRYRFTRSSIEYICDIVDEDLPSLVTLLLNMAPEDKFCVSWILPSELVTSSALKFFFLYVHWSGHINNFHLIHFITTNYNCIHFYTLTKSTVTSNLTPTQTLWTKRLSK